MEDKSYKTAIRRRTLSRPLKELLSNGYLEGTILDYGCGHGNDIVELEKLGYTVYGFDKYHKEYSNYPFFKIKKEKYDNIDIILVTYLFNILSSLEEHQELVDSFKKFNGKVYISVRRDLKAVKKNWEYDKEKLGYWTTIGTFQRFYTENMIKDFFGEVEFIKKDFSYFIFELINDSAAIKV